MSQLFKHFKSAIQAHFETNMAPYELFKMDIDAKKIWETYLNAFPQGTNPIFREQTEHDCTCCRHFIRQAGGIVAVKNGKLISIWDVKVPEAKFYEEVAKALSKYVKSCSISNQFLHYDSFVGTDRNNDWVLIWEHFYLKLPDKVVCRSTDIGTKLGNSLTTHDLFLRGLKEISIDSLETTLELIAQNSLYRGEEHKPQLEEFLGIKRDFDKARDKSLFCWEYMSLYHQGVTHLRNTAIGTLLLDLSDDSTDMERAVNKFEKMVAPTNYKRPTALVTKAMIQKARETIKELGFTSALERRFATLQDITPSDVLFANSLAKEEINSDAFSVLLKEAPVSKKTPKTLGSKVEEVSIETFIQEIIPNATKLEILVENRHVNNLVSLIAPMHMSAKNMFKWDNPFSWTYKGSVTDSIKEKVKAAGGNISGVFRFSGAWWNTDDLDISIIEPNGETIAFCHKTSSTTGGKLDVDMNCNSSNLSRTPVENIVYLNRNKITPGIYTLRVHQYCKRETTDVGFSAQIEFDGQTYDFNYPKTLAQNQIVIVAKIQYKNGEFKILESLEESNTPQSIWSITTQNYHNVQVVTYSPNYWGENPVGNKHYFFFLEGCKNNENPRGFFNEFLTNKLTTHRKTLELVGNKVLVDNVDNQLSGIGFSSTQRNSIMCKVQGTFNRTIKIVI